MLMASFCTAAIFRKCSPRTNLLWPRSTPPRAGRARFSKDGPPTTLGGRRARDMERLRTHTSRRPCTISCLAKHHQINVSKSSSAVCSRRNSLHVSPMGTGMRPAWVRGAYSPERRPTTRDVGGALDVVSRRKFVLSTVALRLEEPFSAAAECTGRLPMRLLETLALLATAERDSPALSPPSLTHLARILAAAAATEF